MLKSLTPIQKTRQSVPPPNTLPSQPEDFLGKKQLTAHRETQSDATPFPATAPAADIVIVGGGIVGLVLALAINKYVQVKPEIYEQSPGFEHDVGAGMGLYANGLRVIRDIDPLLLQTIQDAGYPFQYRRFERHDGTSVAVADETVLGIRSSNGDSPATDQDESEDAGLQTMGIQRWKLQQALHQAVTNAGIPIHYCKKVQTVETPANGMTEVVFTDGTRRQTKLLIGADGGRSTVRSTLLHDAFSKKHSHNKHDVRMPTLDYIGVTCIMGVAENTISRRGISFPVSNTTQCHGAFYPTGENEQCFQYHFPVAAKTVHVDDKTVSICQDSCWGNLSQGVSRAECGKLADILEADGWDEGKFLAPLRNVTKAVRVGFCKLTPALKKWSFPNSQGQSRIVLVGDAAHPPVPYIGQGCQQGLEDAATLALLLQEFCLDDQGKLDLTNINHAVEVYESIRIPRVEEILGNSHFWGDMQQKRAQRPAYNIIKEELIQREVFFHKTTPILFAGTQFDYRIELERTLNQLGKSRNTNIHR